MICCLCLKKKSNIKIELLEADDYICFLSVGVFKVFVTRFL